MPPPSHVREYPVIECDLEFVELTRLGAPLEVFCADPSELPSVGGRTTLGSSCLLYTSPSPRD